MNRKSSKLIPIHPPGLAAAPKRALQWKNKRPQTSGDVMPYRPGSVLVGTAEREVTGKLVKDTENNI